MEIADANRVLVQFEQIPHPAEYAQDALTRTDPAWLEQLVWEHEHWCG